MAVRMIAVLLAVLALTAGAAGAQTPRYIVYYNAAVTPLSRIADADYTHVMLSFLRVGETGGGAPLTLIVPEAVAAQMGAVPTLKKAGKVVMASFGGGAMSAGSWARIAGREAEAARLIADFVRRNGLDGVGIDFEISAALRRDAEAGSFDGRGLLVALTRQLRAALPPTAFISHAPQPPYLDPAWEQGPYLDILRQVGGDIDWIAVQYYNNPSYDEPVASHVVGEASRPVATSVAGLAAGGSGFSWPIEKTVVGKPIFRHDASSGHLPPKQVREEILAPLIKRYGARFGGLMGWEYSDLTADHRFWNREMAPGMLR